MLTKLRSQSDDTKTKLAIVGAIVVTVGIIAVWIMMLPKTLAMNTGSETTDEVKAPSPLRALVGSISQASKSIPKPTKSLDVQPEVSTSGSVSEDDAYDESNPPPSTDLYAGEEVYLEEQPSFQ